MENNSNNEELKDKEKEKENGIRYDPLTNDILRGLLKNSKGIETLWKKIKDNKDGKKLILYKYENDLVKLVAEFTKAFQQVKKNDKDNTINLGKNLASKTEYNNMVTKLLSGDTKTATEFIKKFPHWTIQVGNLFTNSIHYQRIASKVSESNMQKVVDIDSTSNFDVAKKSGDKKTGKESKKGFFKSISSFFNKYIKRGGMGKASKSKVTIELAKFGKYVNEPWRRWWETVADSNTELSKKKAKEFLKSALSDSTADSKSRLVCLFNTGTVKDNNEGLKGPYVKLEVEQESGAKVVKDGKESTVNKMYQIFKAIDAKLGNKAEALFNGAESAKNLDTNDDKINELLKLYNTFKSGKVIKFKKVFGLLGIDTNSGLVELTDDKLKNKVDNLFKDSNFSSDGTAKENVTSLANDARKFLEAYYKKNTTDRFLYELKFLGSAFKVSDLNDVTSVDQAINVLNRAPDLIDKLKINDPEIVNKINEEIAKNTKNINSLDDALKNLKEVDFNNPEGQKELLNALSAIEKNNLLGLGESEKFENLTLRDFCNKLVSVNGAKYAGITNLITKMDIFKTFEDKKINEFMNELKTSLVNQEAKKIDEQNKNIQEIENLFKSIKDEEANYNGGKKALNKPDDGIKIITEIKKLVNYTGTHRTKFLEAVARHIGINDTKIVDKIAKDKPSELAEELKNDRSHLLLQKIRNLIAYGIFGHKSFLLGKDEGSTSNKMPKDLK